MNIKTRVNSRSCSGTQARRCNIDPSVYMPAAAPALSTLTSSYDEMQHVLAAGPKNRAGRSKQGMAM